MTFTVEDAIKRGKLYNVSEWGKDSGSVFPSTLGSPVTELADANVYSSELRNGTNLHQVIIDLDIEAVLVPSSTPGHSHLLINRVCSFDTYIALLEAFARAGIVQKGYVDAAKSPHRQAAMLRLPWVRKDTATVTNNP